jgi:hypothetical protein
MTHIPWPLALIEQRPGRNRVTVRTSITKLVPVRLIPAPRLIQRGSFARSSHGQAQGATL